MYIQFNALENTWITTRLEELSRKLRNCNPEHWPPESMISFLDQMDTCATFHEMFLLKVNGWSLWQVLLSGGGVLPRTVAFMFGTRTGEFCW